MKKKVKITPEIIEISLTVVFVIFIISAAVQLLYYWGIFCRLAFFKTRNINNEKQPVSVVIAASNEYDNLKENLPLILEQDYPDFEVIVVNNYSNDDSEYFLKTFSEKYKNIKVITIPENLNFFKGKKFPLSVGIKSAKNELLLLTDADCKPKTKNWISEMQSGFGENIQLVLAYGAYETKKGFLNSIIRCDTLQIAIQYFSFSLIGQTYMGVGRNLAYKKTLFITNKGFSSHYKISSGDDDLFINKVAAKKNTNIIINHQSHTLSTPKETFSEWTKQKKRHLTTANLYKFKHKFLLGNYSLSQFMFYLSSVILLAMLYNIKIVLPLILFKLFSQLFIFKKCMIKLDEKKILLISLITEILLIFIIPVLSLSNLLYKTDKWK